MRRFWLKAMLLTILLPASARAQVSVLGLEADTGAEKMAKWVTDALRSWAKAKGMKLGQAKELLEMKAVFGCMQEKPVCMAQIAKAIKVQRIIFGKVRLKGAKYIVVLKMLDLRSPQNLDTVTQTMPISTATRSSVRLAVARWAASLAGVAQTGKLKIFIRPRGASVSVDNKDLGSVPSRGPMVLDLSPGSHKVTASKAGYQSRTQTVQVVVGSTATIRLTLPKVVEPLRPVPPRPLVRVTPPRPRPDVQPKVDITPTPTKPKRSRAKLWWQIAFYSAAGVAVVLAASAIGTGVKYQSLQKDKDDRIKSLAQDPVANSWVFTGSGDVCNAAKSHDKKTSDLCSDGTKMANITNALWAVAGAFAITAGVFSYFAFFKKYPKEEQETAPDKPRKELGFSIVPEINPKGGAGVNIQLRF